MGFFTSGSMGLVHLTPGSDRVMRIIPIEDSPTSSPSFRVARGHGSSHRKTGDVPLNHSVSDGCLWSVRMTGTRMGVRRKTPRRRETHSRCSSGSRGILRTDRVVTSWLRGLKPRGDFVSFVCSGWNNELESLRIRYDFTALRDVGTNILRVSRKLLTRTNPAFRVSDGVSSYLHALSRTRGASPGASTGQATRRVAGLRAQNDLTRPRLRGGGSGQ